jgi:hypothetical protein
MSGCDTDKEASIPGKEGMLPSLPNVMWPSLQDNLHLQAHVFKDTLVQNTLNIVCEFF